MLNSIAIISSVALLANAGPIPAHLQRQRQHLQNNLSPNKDHKIYQGSLGSNYRPDQDSSDIGCYDAKQGPEIRANGQMNNAHASDNEDLVEQNKIMNEISNIIQQNNQKVRNIKNTGDEKLGAPEAPILNGEPNEKVPVNLVEPIVNVRDPNNAEEFEKQPRIDERIPLVNREIFKVPEQRSPIANDNEGIVYNAPKVHERIPIKDNNEIKLNDLENLNNVDAVIKDLDERLKQNGEFHSNMPKAEVALGHHEGLGGHQIQNHGDLIHDEHHHHHLHRGADMVHKAVKDTK